MKKSRKNTSAKSTNRNHDIPNKFEHHLDIKKNPLIPFKSRDIKFCRSVYCNWHDSIELLLIYDGTGVLHYGTQDIEISPDLLVIINPQTMHSITSDKGVSFHMIIIDNGFFEENGIDITKYTFMQMTRDKKIINMYLDTCNEYRDRHNDADLLSTAKLRHSFLALIIELCSGYILSENPSFVSTGGSEKYVKQAMEYINDNYTEKITLDSVARIIGINKSYFAREFKKYAGQTVHTYINNLRCTRADRCLADGKSVTEAALEAGFGTLSYFSRTYRKIRGMAPVMMRGKY